MPTPRNGKAGAGAEQSAFAAALATKGATVRGLTDGRGRAAADRFGIYRNNVVVSLADALEATFPATRRLMGADFFRAAAVAYAEECKPSSPLLFRYGETFPDLLSALPGLAPYPFVPEAARIEYARLQAYHAADVDPLSADALAALAPEDLPLCRFEPHPATRLLETPRGGLSAWLANQDPPAAPREGAAALVTRPAMDVLTTALDAPAATCAAALIAGSPLGEAAAAEDLDLAAALGTLLSAGAFRAVRVSESS